MPRCPKYREASPSPIKNPHHIFKLCLTITKITISGLSQLNFDRPFIVTFVIVNHICAQLEDMVQILRARFWQTKTRCVLYLKSKHDTSVFCSRKKGFFFIKQNRTLTYYAKGEPWHSNRILLIWIWSWQCNDISTPYLLLLP